VDNLRENVLMTSIRCQSVNRLYVAGRVESVILIESTMAVIISGFQFRAAKRAAMA